MTTIVYRVGQIGDTVVSLPAMRAIRDLYPKDELVLLTDYHPTRRNFVPSWQILKHAGIFDKVIHYSPSPLSAGTLIQFARMVQTVRKLKASRLFYLAPIRRKVWKINRDYFIFNKICGIKTSYGFKTGEKYSRLIGSRNCENRLRRLPSEMSRLLEVVKEDDDGPHKIDFHFPKRESDIHLVSWMMEIENIPKDSWIIPMAPFSKMKLKRWPLERYIELGKKVLAALPDAYLIILGSNAERPMGEEICEGIGERVINWSGLDLLTTSEVIRRGKMFIGSDSGLMHIAASVGTTCVAIFSAKDHPGMWYPYGDGHQVLRKYVPCEGCFLEDCVEMKMKCIMDISVEEVFEAFLSVVHGESVNKATEAE